MRKVLKWASLVVLFLLFSCVKGEKFSDISSLSQPDVTGYIIPMEYDNEPAEFATKAKITSWPSFQFEVDDPINIWSSAGTYLLYHVVETSGNSATFDGGGFTLTPNETYYSSFPLLIPSVLIDPNTALSISFEGQVQAADGDANHVANYTYTWAKSTTDANAKTHFGYARMCSYVEYRITLPEAMTLTEISLSSVGADLFALNGKGNITNGAFTNGTMTNKLTLQLDNVSVTDGVLNAFLAVAPFEAGNFVVQVKGDKGTYTSTEFPMTAIAPNKIRLIEQTVYPGETPGVAKIGDIVYPSLAEAVAAVPTDGTATTITMIGNDAIDIVGSAITIAATKNIVLDLNGHQVVGTAEQATSSALITNRGNLTIKDSSDTNKDGTGTGKLISGATSTWEYGGDGNYAGSYASNTITNTGTLTIESGYIENISTGSAVFAVDNNSSAADAILNMNGGVLKAHSVAVREFANSNTKENTINMTAGTMEAGYSAIWIQLPGSDATKAMHAELNVSGGTLTGGSYAFYDYTYGNLFDQTQYNLSGGTFNGSIFSYGANITITDGTYCGDVAIKQSKPSNLAVSGGKFAGDVYNYGANATGGFISGGIFAINTYEDEGVTYDCDWLSCIAEGYMPADNTDPTTMSDYPYTVKSGTYVAKVGDIKYETLEEAWNAAQDGDTITLLADCEGNGLVAPQGKYSEGLTVDFNGHTYTVNGNLVGSTGTETQALQLLKDNNITLKNGTIYSEKALFLVQNYSNLTLKGMTLTLNNANYAYGYTLSNNNGEIVIDDSTINANPNGLFAFDVCRNSSYPSVNVTVKGESVINGDVEVSASGNDPKDGFSLMLETAINGNIVLDDSAKAAMAASPDKAKVSKLPAVEQVAPDGYKWAEDGENKESLVACTNVAKIGDTEYETLAAAIAAVQSGETIMMIADHTIEGNAGVVIPVGIEVVLDLNGKTVTLSVTESKGSQLITNRGNLTITDSSSEKNGKLTNAAAEGLAVGSWPTNNYVTNIITNTGTLNIEAGTIQSTANGSICYAVDNNSTSYDAVLNVSGGYLTSVGTVVRQFCNSTTKQNVVNISGGTVETAGYAAMWTQLPGSSATSKKLATLNITGGVVRGATYAWYDYSYGDSFEAVDYSISGGELYGSLYSYAVSGGVKPGFITGGLFSKNVNSLCAEGLMSRYNSTLGMYEIVPAEVYYSWEQDGNIVGENCLFNDPFINGWLLDGENITLLKDVTLTQDLTWNTEGNATFTLNLGDFKITKGSFSVKLSPGQAVNASKSAAIFTTDAEGYYVLSTKNADDTYTYTVEEADLMFTAANGTVSYKPWSSTVVSTSGTYKLVKDVTASARIAPGIMASDVTLDLNGYTLTSTATDCAILLSRNGTSTSPKIFNLIDSSSEKGGMLKVNPDANIGIQVSGKYNQVTIGEGITVDDNCVAMLSENQTLTVNGTINGGNDFAVATNGSSTKNTTITINNGAVLTSDETAMYLPGNVGLETTVNGGTITGGKAGIEIRAGKLVVNGGDITSTATTYSYTPNDNGTTTRGAAVAVVQHNTVLPIDAQILGGTLTGVNQIAVVDAQNNDLEGVSVKAKDNLVGTTTIPSGFQWVSDGALSTLTPVVILVGDGYSTMTDALNSAESGATIKLMEDYDLRGEQPSSGYNRMAINKSVTIDGNNHILTVKGRGLAPGMGASSKVDVTFKNITVENSSDAARCIDTRGNIGTLTLDNVTLSTEGSTIGFTQPLTIGGSQSTSAIVDITNSTIQTNSTGTAYYAIITFNPVNMNITGSTLKGWACIYAKGPDGSAGSAGSVFTVTNSTIESNNVYNGESNSFGAITIEDNNVTVNVSSSNVNIHNSGDAQQAIGCFEPGKTGNSISLNGNSITFDNAGTGECVNVINQGSNAFVISD